MLAGTCFSVKGELSCISWDHNAKSQRSTGIWDARHLAYENRTLHHKVFLSVKASGVDGGSDSLKSYITSELSTWITKLYIKHKTMF